MEINKVYNDNFLNNSIPDEFIDCLITDPPYKIISGGSSVKRKDNVKGIFEKNEKTHWSDYARKGTMFKENDIKFSDWLTEAYRILKDGTHAYIMTNDRNMKELLNEGEKAGFKLVNILVWKKNNATPNRYYMKNGEFIVMFRKGKARTINNRGNKTIFEIDNILGNKLHPSEKPEKLIELLLLNSTDENECICDPFMGSFTSAAVAKKNNRNFIGFEIDKDFYEIGQERLKKIKK